MQMNQTVSNDLGVAQIIQYIFNFIELNQITWSLFFHPDYRVEIAKTHLLRSCCPDLLSVASLQDIFLFLFCESWDRTRHLLEKTKERKEEARNLISNAEEPKFILQICEFNSNKWNQYSKGGATLPQATELALHKISFPPPLEWRRAPSQHFRKERIKWIPYLFISRRWWTVR